MNLIKAVSDTIETYQKFAAQYYRKHFGVIDDHPWTDEFIVLLTGSQILDAGCGPGIYSHYFASRHLNVTGIDLASNFLAIASNESPESLFCLMDLRELTFPQGSFDGIWAHASFLHIPKEDAIRTLQGFKHVLKNGGVLYVDVEKGRQEKILRLKEYNEEPRFLAFYEASEFKDLIESCGFDIEKIEVDSDQYGWIRVLAKAHD